MAKKEIIKNGLVTVRVNEAPVVDAAHKVVDVVESIPSEVVSAVESVPSHVVEGAEVLEGVAEAAATQVAKVSRNNPYILGSVAVAAAAVGSVAGYYYAKRKIVAYYDARYEREMEATKKHYEMTQKVGPFETVEKAAEELLTDAAEAVRSYQGEQMAPLGIPPRDLPTKVVSQDDEGEPVTKYVSGLLVEGPTSVDFDYDQELSMRASNPDAPYVMSRDEFNENEGNLIQDTLTYYAGDDTLVDTRDQVIDNTEYTVGDDNLLRFGHGSGDENVVYIRNERTGTDFEVIRDPNSYSVTVLGLKTPELRHSDTRRGSYRFRSADE
jgi:hypothetical protein